MKIELIYKTNIKLVWFVYDQLIKLNMFFHFSKTSKRTSLSCGSMNGYVTDLPAAPPN